MRQTDRWTERLFLVVIVMFNYSVQPKSYLLVVHAGKQHLDR